MAWWRARRAASPPEPGMALCIGGAWHGKLHPMGDRLPFAVNERHVSGSIGGLETPTLETLYTLRHIVVPGRTFHIWQADNGDGDDPAFRDAIVTLLDASASERATVECLPVHECQLTSGEGVVR